MRSMVLILFVIRDILFAPVQAQGTIVVAPLGFDTKEGDSAGIPLFGGENHRTQVVYNSQLFASLPPGGAYLTELAFRMDGRSSAPFTGTADVEIRLSTTTAGANALGSSFANNIGADETVVLPEQVLPLSSGPANPGGPNSFSVVVPLPTKFRYDPAKGNLLLDASVRSVARLSNLDWDTSLNDGVSTLIGDLGTSSGVVSSSGLVTRFTFEIVPEPSELSCFVFGGAILIFIRRSKNVVA